MRSLTPMACWIWARLRRSNWPWRSTHIRANARTVRPWGQATMTPTQQSHLRNYPSGSGGIEAGFRMAARPARRCSDPGHHLPGGLPSVKRRGSRDQFVTIPAHRSGVTETGGAQSHGRTQAKNLAQPARDAPQPRGIADRGTCRMPQLWGAEAAAPCLRALRVLQWARGGGGRKGAEGRRPGLKASPGQTGRPL